jgi:PAS domain S-box-containing protein
MSSERTNSTGEDRRYVSGNAAAVVSDADVLRHHLEAAGSMLVVLDARGWVARINRRTCEILGAGPEAILEKDWFATFLPERMRAAVRTVFEDLVAGRAPHVHSFENPVLTFDGHERQVVWFNTLLHDPAGRVIGTLSTGEDVTERRAAEEALRAAHAELEARVAERTQDLEMFRRIVDEMPVGVSVVRLVDPKDDESFVYVTANDANNRFLRADYRKEAGRRVVDVRPQARATGLLPKLAQAVRDGAPLDMGEIHYPDMEGRPRWFRSRGFPLPGHCLAVIYDDITERKESELAVAQTNRFLDSVIENIPDMIFVKDSEHLRFVRFNRAGEDLLGMGRDELLGKSDYDFFPKDEADFFTGKDPEVLGSGQLRDIPEEPIHTRRGLRWLHTKKIPIPDASGKPAFLLGISEDITGWKAQADVLSRAHDELGRRAAELARSNAELEQFAYVASHDLQEPLRKVRAFGDRLASRAGAALDEESRDYLRRMQSAAARMSQLIDALLVYSRVTTQGRAFVPVDLSKVAREVLGDLESRLQESGAHVDLGSLPTLPADPVQMRQLFQNLLGNALKFARPGQPPRVRIRAEPEGDDGWRVSIQDEGVGFDEQYTDKLFQPFGRLHTRTEFEGTGMGLAICRKIVERHGGTLSAQSRTGEGATFTVTLPLRNQEGGAT